jgi:hypothetical protein
LPLFTVTVEQGSSDHQITGGYTMSATPTIYCRSCNAWRVVADWRERGENLVIELERCGHLAVRNARVEWVVKRVAA